MTKALDEKMRDARKACLCLFAQVPEEVARDVLDKVDAAITGYRDALAQARREGRKEAWEAVANEASHLLMPSTVNDQLIDWCRAQAAKEAT